MMLSHIAVYRVSRGLAAMFTRTAPLSDADFMLGICAQRRVAVRPSNWITSTRVGQQKSARFALHIHVGRG